MYWLLEKQGKLYFLQSSQTKGRGVLLPPLQPGFVKDTAFLSAKAKSSRIRHSPNSGDSLPVFVAQSFVLSAFATLVCQRNCGFSLQRHKSTRIRLVPNSWDSYAGFCGTELRFCRLCNFDLPNKQRFSLQRHKTAESGLCRILGIVMPVFCGTELKN